AYRNIVLHHCLLGVSRPPALAEVEGIKVDPLTIGRETARAWTPVHVVIREVARNVNVSAAVGIGGNRLIDIESAVAGPGAPRSVVSDVADIHDVIDAGAGRSVVSVKSTAHTAIGHVV